MWFNSGVPSTWVNREGSMEERGFKTSLERHLDHVLSRGCEEAVTGVRSKMAGSNEAGLHMNYKQSSKTGPPDGCR